MRRFAAVAITSGALVAGLTAAVSPADASTKSAERVAGVQEDFGVEATAVRQGTIAGKSLLAEAKREGKPYSAKETTAIKKASRCRWVERTRGGKTSRRGRWLFYVKLRLSWCYDGLYVVSARARYGAYTYNKRVWRWRGWAKKSLKHTRTWSSVTSEVQGRFYYTRNRRTYKPWIIALGSFNGQYRTWAGG